LLASHFSITHPVRVYYPDRVGVQRVRLLSNFASNPETMFAVYSVYLKPIEEVDIYLEAHRTFLKTLYAKGITICSGPQIPRTGGFILMKAASKDEALSIMHNDPYVINGMARYSVIEFDVRSYAEGFEQFIG
jgi:uncharacterized protein YciI